MNKEKYLAKNFGVNRVKAKLGFYRLSYWKGFWMMSGDQSLWLKARRMRVAIFGYTEAR